MQFNLMELVNNSVENCCYQHSGIVSNFRYPNLEILEKLESQDFEKLNGLVEMLLKPYENDTISRIGKPVYLTQEEIEQDNWGKFSIIEYGRFNCSIYSAHPGIIYENKRIDQTNESFLDLLLDSRRKILHNYGFSIDLDLKRKEKQGNKISLTSAELINPIPKSRKRRSLTGILRKFGVNI